MANFQLSWTPATTSNGQIPYRIAKVNEGTTSWVAAPSLSSVTNNYLWSGLNANTIYKFKISNQCAAGGPTEGNTYEWLEFQCFPITVSNLTDTSVTLTGLTPNPTPLDGGAFVTPYTEIDNYEYSIYDATNTTLISGPTLGTILPSSGGSKIDLTGLSPSTVYTVRYVMLATVNSTEIRSEDSDQLGVYCSQQFTTQASPQGFSVFLSIGNSVVDACNAVDTEYFMDTPTFGQGSLLFNDINMLSPLSVLFVRTVGLGEVYNTLSGNQVGISTGTTC